MAIQHLRHIIPRDNLFVSTILPSLYLFQRIRLGNSWSIIVSEVERTSEVRERESIVEEATSEISIAHDGSLRFPIVAKEGWIKLAAVLICQEIYTVDIGSRCFSSCRSWRGVRLRYRTRNWIAWIAAGHIQLLTEGDLTFRISMTYITFIYCI